MTEPDWLLRDATGDDFAEIATLYAHHVATGFGTFEEVAPTPEEMRRRFTRMRGRGLPWLVVERSGRLAGYCYASPYHPRSAYRFSVQDSVYVDERHWNRGIGTALLGAVIERCTGLGYRQMMATVGDSANEGSLRLHARLGFRTIGQALAVGAKLGRWVDIVFLQRALGEPVPMPPARDPVGWLPPADQAGP